MKHTEYIIPIGEEAKDFDEIFIGVLRKHKELIRCKDCKWFDMSDPSGTVEPIGYRCKKVTRLWREPDDYCKGAEREEE